MRQCGVILRDIARALEDVRKTAEAIQTRRRVVKAVVRILIKIALDIREVQTKFHSWKTFIVRDTLCGFSPPGI